MEDLLKKMFMFVMSAKEDDVLCIHIEETGEMRHINSVIMKFLT